MLSLILGALISLESISSISQWKKSAWEFSSFLRISLSMIYCRSSSLLFFLFGYFKFFCVLRLAFFLRVPQWILIMRYGIHFQYCWVQGVGRVQELVGEIFIKSNYVARNVFTLETLPDIDNPCSFQVLAMFFPPLFAAFALQQGFKVSIRLGRHSMPDNWYLKSLIIVCDEVSSGWMSCDPSTQCEFVFVSNFILLTEVSNRISCWGIDKIIHKFAFAELKFTWTYTPKYCFSRRLLIELYGSHI